MECTIQPNNSRHSNIRLVIVLLAVLLSIISFIYSYAALQVQVQSHALENHDTSEVTAIRNCINKSGPIMTFREPDKRTFHLLCQLPDGKIGDQVVVKDGNKLVEKSSFIPKNGNWKDILNWLLRKGATKFGGNIQ